MDVTERVSESECPISRREIADALGIPLLTGRGNESTYVRGFYNKALRICSEEGREVLDALTKIGNTLHGLSAKSNQHAAAWRELERLNRERDRLVKMLCTGKITLKRV